MQSVGTIIDVAISTVYIANYYFFINIMSQNAMLLEGP